MKKLYFKGVQLRNLKLEYGPKVFRDHNNEI